MPVNAFGDVSTHAVNLLAKVGRGIGSQIVFRDILRGATSILRGFCCVIHTGELVRIGGFRASSLSAFREFINALFDGILGIQAVLSFCNFRRLLSHV